MTNPAFEIAVGETVAIPLQVRNSATKVGLNLTGLSVELTANTERSPKDTVNQVFKKTQVSGDIVQTTPGEGKITVKFTLAEWALITARSVIFIDVWVVDGSSERQRVVQTSAAKLDQPINQG